MDTSLVLVDESRPAGTRYRLLETLRQYGRDRLAAGGATAAADERHAAYFLDLATTTAGALRGPQQVAALDRLEAEHDNLRAALDGGWRRRAPRARACASPGRCGASGGRAATGGRARRGWGGSWRCPPDRRTRRLARRDWPAGRPCSTTSESGPPPAPCTKRASRPLGRSATRAGAAQALAGLGHLARNAGDFAAARRLLRESLDLWREVGNRAGAADALRDLAMTAEFAERHVEARPLYQEALAMYARLGDDRGAARCLEGLANSLRAHGDATAAARYEESLRLARAVGDTRSIGFCLSGLRWLALDRGDYATAEALLREALACFRQPGDQRGLASVLRGYAALALVRGEPERTLRLLGAAAALREPSELAILPSADANYVRRAEELARQQLEQETADAAWAAGWATPLEQSVAFAVDGAHVGAHATAARAPGGARAAAVRRRLDDQARSE